MELLLTLSSKVRWQGDIVAAQPDFIFGQRIDCTVNITGPSPGQNIYYYVQATSAVVPKGSASGVFASSPYTFSIATPSNAIQSTDTVNVYLGDSPDVSANKYLLKLEGVTLSKQPSGTALLTTASSSFIVPENVYTIKAVCRGPGGGGGGGFKGSLSRSGGNGGNGGSDTVTLAVVPGDVLLLSAGVGGQGGAGSTSYPSSGTQGTNLLLYHNGAWVSVSAGGGKGGFAAGSGSNGTAGANSGDGLGMPGGGGGYSTSSGVKGTDGQITLTW